MPEPAHWDEVETPEPGWSRRAVLLAAGVGAAGLALSDAPQALARAATSSLGICQASCLPG